MTGNRFKETMLKRNKRELKKKIDKVIQKELEEMMIDYNIIYVVKRGKFTFLIKKFVIYNQSLSSSNENLPVIGFKHSTWSTDTTFCITSPENSHYT